jgi:beta-galactosidase
MVMEFGCAWYPEQWNPSRWATDLELMKAARMNVVRVGESAWSRMEPEEGRYDLEWLAQAIDAAAGYGLGTVIGTPTAAPPAWLTQRYPETLVVREDGHRATHGHRCQCSPVSPRYRALCAGVVEQLAMRFGKHPSVIAWQIDNEYNALSYDEVTRERFLAYLRDEYKTLGRLNTHLAAAYLSQTYTSWSQIPLPGGGHNPALMLHFHRFISRMIREYQHVQTEVIRRHSKYPITHNFMGWCELFDHYVVSEELDFASRDSCVGEGHLDALASGASHDVIRGLRRKNFWLMETQPGWGTGAKVNNCLNRGESRAKAWHAISHGADAVLYWQWRSALNGQEQYHGSLVSADGQPRPVYTEVAEIGTDMERAREVLLGTRLETDCAILHSYDDRWALNFQRHHQDFDPVAYLQSFYQPLRTLLHTVDIISSRTPLSGYRVVVCPILHLLDEELACLLSYFVGNGGHLVLGARSGMKDKHSSLWPLRQPGPLRPMLGAHVEEFFALDTPVPLLPSGEAKIWAEWLQGDLPDVEVKWRYGVANGWLDGKAAVVSRRIGTGSITYLGGWFDDQTMMTLAKEWAAHSKLTRFPVPAGVEVGCRVGDQGECYVLINHTTTEQSVDLPFPVRDLLSALEHQDRLVLGRYQVAVLRAKNA